MIAFNFPKLVFYIILSIAITVNVRISYSITGIKSQTSQLFSKARQGDKRAQYLLGIAYMSGKQVQFSRRKAVRWLKKSAAQRYYKAWYRLGEMHYDGIYKMQNYSSAFKWYLKPATQSHGISQYKVALLYFRGRGVTQNSTKALIWATRARSNGIFSAAALLHQIKLKMARATRSKKVVTLKLRGKKAITVKLPPKPALPLNIPKLLSEGRWKMNGIASDYLPSSSTQCTEIRDKIRCTSKVKKIQRTGYRADFRIISLIDDFRPPAKFRIRYRNKYTAVSHDNPDQTVSAPGLGVGDKVFYIQCRALHSKQIRCFTADNTVVVFSN